MSLILIAVAKEAKKLEETKCACFVGHPVYFSMSVNMFKFMGKLYFLHLHHGFL